MLDNVFRQAKKATQIIKFGEPLLPQAANF